MTSKERGLKTRTPLSNSIKNELFVGLERIKELTLIDKSKLLDQAVHDLILKYEKKLGMKIL